MYQSIKGADRADTFASQLRRGSAMAVEESGEHRGKGRSSFSRASFQLSSQRYLGIAMNGFDEFCDSEDEEDKDSNLLNREEDKEVKVKLNKILDQQDPEFESMFQPDEMRCLALVAHNHMKPAMRDFIESHPNLLKKYRITGTNSTMKMVESVFGDDPSVVYGPTCTSGPLGGDAQLCALMVMEDVGGIIFFTDPLSAHPHQADIESLIRMANVCNVMMLPNPTSAHAMCTAFRVSLISGRKDMAPSFFMTLESPAVEDYKSQQKAIVNHVSGDDCRKISYLQSVNERLQETS